MEVEKRGVGEHRLNLREAKEEVGRVIFQRENCSIILKKDCIMVQKREIFKEIVELR